MTSNAGHVYHHAKFRWTENLTCRFIQLRKEHGKMFTGRKYSAQAGWEYILQQMREEFPTIMADVHYRVLKKKWSNLLQQYKELKNPVHGDKNKADDISWPFYAAIDEVLGNVSPSPPAMWRSPDDEDDDDEQLVNPQEFLCVSVGDHDEDDENGDGSPVNPSENINEYNGGGGGERLTGLPRLQPLGRGGRGGGPVFDVERLPRTTRRSTTTTTTMNSSRKRSAPSDEADLLSRLPRTTELTIRPVAVPALEPISVNGRELEIVKEEASRRQEDFYDDDDGQEEERPPRKKYTRGGEACAREDRLERLERRMAEFLEYTKKRDEENRSILLRMLEAIEDIRRAVS